MKGKHRNMCAEIQPCCLCNTCKRDVLSGEGKLCCNNVTIYCPVENCPDYEPDDEEDDDA
jgi:hypothetical protein